MTQPDLTALLADLRLLTEIESPSGDARGIARVMDVVQGWLEELGAKTEHLVGDTRRFTIGDGDGGVLILAHADTVWPHGTLDRMPWRVEGDKVFGPGTYDMKGGIVGAVHALKLVRDRLSLPVEVLLTPDEEVGSLASREHIEAAARRARAVLVVEPPVAESHALKTGRKGVGMYHVRVHGVSSHAGNAPQQGASAISEAARSLLRVESFARPDLGTTLSTGRIGGGGPVNVVPDLAEFWTDVRVSTLAEAERLEREVRGMTAADSRVTLEVLGGLNRPPFERTPGTARLYERARQVAVTLGFDVSEAFVGGGSDGNFTAPLAPTLDGLGSPGDGAHALHEHVRLDVWPRHVRLLAELIRDPGV
ncbi:M20 family metallopeptidase [Deinococcus yavapaiensis]|uniref:Glutamate carboxypeptidase n=1 Tax=Deinococcus yavapaiensis KR-236 TaxID=694435 RepID=A0A318S7U7_9DEIO|nr:M20 family metallopeptidase [Deinococcus yavapaiensis]PYE51111.1 glutamate carboxypeptidase [Deinococcus yavapaiensis KR-236]